MTVSMEDFLQLRNRVDELEKEKIEKDKEELELALNKFLYCGNLNIRTKESIEGY